MILDGNEWIETSHEVYAVIFAKHKNNLAPHSSYTDMDGYGHTWSNGHPEIMTEWGFRESNSPLLKIIQTKEHATDKDWNCKFYIFCNHIDR